MSVTIAATSTAPIRGKCAKTVHSREEATSPAMISHIANTPTCRANLEELPTAWVRATIAAAHRKAIPQGIAASIVSTYPVIGKQVCYGIESTAACAAVEACAWRLSISVKLQLHSIDKLA